MMTSRQLTHINELIEALARQQTIPPSHLATLEERLVIACKSRNRQLRGIERRSRREIRYRYKQNKAQKVYLNVLDENPHLFLPFLLWRVWVESALNKDPAHLSISTSTVLSVYDRSVH
ncbi:hypothetical protein F4677DRAFT_439044 [Hypoxylon crocopeplum]|nr:hypothetical protein F4677DRAFT_439044 [Hypoxylon crocopeplum]